MLALRVPVLRSLTTLILLGLLAGCSGETPQRAGSTPSGNSHSDLEQAAPAGGLKRFIILTNGNAPFWDAAAAGARDAEKELNCDADGFKVVVDRNDFKAEGQIDKLRQYSGQTDIVGVAISVTDADNPSIPDELRKLQQAGVKVVTIDSDVNRQSARDCRFVYLGTDNVVGGKKLGAAAKGLLPDGGKYATFVGLKSAANAQERIAGFAEGAGEKFSSAENLGDQGDEAVARANVRDALDRNQDMAILVGIWSYNTPAIIDIVKQLNAREKLKIVGFDADPPAIQGMQEGILDVMVVQNPYQMGFQGVRILQALVKNDEATVKDMFPNRASENGDLYDTGLKVVVPNEGSPLKADLFGPKTEFLKLDAFKEWLTKYNLTGS
jgi:ribose transport system substrate-binding protein